jgi:uncharacterized coiled-coil DUF342 family protein
MDEQMMLKKLKSLEFKYMTNVMTESDERNLLREIDALRRKLEAMR